MTNKKLPYVDTETIETTAKDTEPTTVGRVEFETADALPNGAADYTVHPALRDRVLLWRHQLHEQNHQNGDGIWVYRATHTSGWATEARDVALTPIEDSVEPPVPPDGPAHLPAPAKAKDA